MTDSKAITMVGSLPGIAAVQRDANFQWYLSRARNTVYFASYSPREMTPAAFRKMVADVIGLAPQLNLRHDDRRQAHVDVRPFDLEAITTFAEVPSFAGFPDSVLGPNEDLFEAPGLPNFRAACYVLPKGQTDAAGNRAFMVFRASHALMEGIDTAEVMRGRPSNHRAPYSGERSLWSRFTTALIGALVVPANHVISWVQWRQSDSCGLRTLAFDRAALKDAATTLGVQQRSLLFALVMYGLYHQGGQGRTPSKRRRIIGYSNLPPRRFAGDDAFVRLRMQVTTMGYDQSFAAYVRELDEKLAKAGNKSLGLQMHYNSIMGYHRRIEKVLPFLYRRKFFRFVPYDFVLSLVPPHTPGGIFSEYQLNGIYCGSHSPGVNCCVVVPQRDRITVNVYGPEPLLDRMGGIATLLSELGISTVEPATPVP